MFSSMRRSLMVEVMELNATFDGTGMRFAQLGIRSS
jgi:hypothetical protein